MRWCGSHCHKLLSSCFAGSLFLNPNNIEVFVLYHGSSWSDSSAPLRIVIQVHDGADSPCLRQQRFSDPPAKQQKKRGAMSSSSPPDLSAVWDAMNKLTLEVRGMNDRVEGQIHEVASKITEVNEEVDNLEAATQAKFAEIEQRLLVWARRHLPLPLDITQVVSPRACDRSTSVPSARDWGPAWSPISDTTLWVTRLPFDMTTRAHKETGNLILAELPVSISRQSTPSSNYFGRPFRLDFPTKEQATAACKHFKDTPFMWFHSDNDGDSEPFRLKIEHDISPPSCLQGRTWRKFWSKMKDHIDENDLTTSPGYQLLQNEGKLHSVRDRSWPLFHAKVQEAGTVEIGSIAANSLRYDVTDAVANIWVAEARAAVRRPSLSGGPCIAACYRAPANLANALANGPLLTLALHLGPHCCSLRLWARLVLPFVSHAHDSHCYLECRFSFRVSVY